MKLIRCNIVNYGCLHDFSFEFNSGINLINRPNGWGKSTLVSFLCSMLYGLDSTNRRSIQNNERKHYQPWQGGVFGGSLEFEIAGKQYRAERFFGRREKEDTFVLYDLKTMLPSQDYSSRLGFELFGIDKSGYLKSTCIPQSDPGSEYNNTLAARLAGLTQTTDDINQYEQAVAAIDKALRFYVKTGKRGEISLLEQESEISSRQLQEALQAGKDINRLSSELSDLEQIKKQISARLQDVQRQIELAAFLEMQSHYNLLIRQQQQKEQEVELIEDFFHDHLPEESDIESCLQTCSQLSQAQIELQHESFNDSQSSDFAFLQSLFNNCSISESDAKAVKWPDRADTEYIFTPAQKKLLMNSAEYAAEALVLFSPEDDFSAYETISPQESLPEADTIQLARKLYIQYHDFLAEQKTRNLEVISLTQKLEQLKLSIHNENLMISDCRQKMQLLQPQDRLSEPETEPSDYKKSPEISIQSTRWNLSERLQIVFSLILLTVSLLIGYFSFTTAGFLLGLISFLFLAYKMLQHLPLPHQRGTEDKNPENDNSQKQRIQLETEIQLRTTTCTELEQQFLQVQKQLSPSENALCSVSSAADSCLQQLTELSKQLKIPYDRDSLMSDDYLTQLALLTSRLESYEQTQKKQYEQYRKQSDFYNKLKQKYENYRLRFQHQQKLARTVSDLKTAIIDYLLPYFPNLNRKNDAGLKNSETPASLEAKLHSLNAHLASYKKLLAGSRSAAEAVNIFLQEHPDFAKQQNLFQEQIASPRSLSDLQTEESVLRERYTDCIRKISLCQSQIRQKQDIADSSQSLEDKVSQLKQKIADYQERYRILSLTKHYLSKARQDFTDNYLRSIEKNFNRYARILQKDLLLNASMNSDFHILVPDNGVLRETDWYSQGTRDLIDLCSRLSIIEDLFSDESPFLVMDDPFVNLDDRSFQQLSVILHDIADKWQILYFTCHSSRNI